ncbi:MAG: hypothetical protein IPG52_11100 [Rhodocyclaceae bacterium]|nr:hypothetical protein [Rhodocyclaceae bacterium]
MSGVSAVIINPALPGPRTTAAWPGPPGLAGLAVDVAMGRLGLFEATANTGAAGRAGEDGGIRFWLDEHLLFGILDIEESDFRRGGQPPRQAAEDAYHRVFALIERERRPHLWRTWNYLADINQATDGLERYRQFNQGRHDAFVAGGRLTRGAVPAACALGTRSGR